MATRDAQVPPRAGGDRNQEGALCAVIPSLVERLIGTLRRECLDRTLFWTTTDLEAKLLDFQHYYNEHRTHAGRQGHPPVTGVNADRSRANLSCYRWSRLIPNADGCLILVIRHRQGAEPQSGVLFL